MTTPLDKLLREFGFNPEDFPQPVRANPTLLRYVEDLPRELRAEYLDAVCDFFRIYTSLNYPQRDRMLKLFESGLRNELERKR